MPEKKVRKKIDTPKKRREERGYSNYVTKQHYFLSAEICSLGKVFLAKIRVQVHINLCFAQFETESLTQGRICVPCQMLASSLLGSANEAQHVQVGGVLTSIRPNISTYDRYQLLLSCSLLSKELVDMKDKSTLLIGSNLRYGLNIFDCHHYSLNSLLRSLKRPWLKNQFSSILIHLFYFIILLKTLYINQENICKQIEI